MTPELRTAGAWIYGGNAESSQLPRGGDSEGGVRSAAAHGDGWEWSCCLSAARHLPIQMLAGRKQARGTTQANARRLWFIAHSTR